MNNREEMLTQMFGETMAKVLTEGETRLVAKRQLDMEAAEDLKAMVKAVLDNAAGRDLLKVLAGLFFRQSVYPPPSGQTSGEYAAHCEGKREIISLLINLVHEE